MDRHLQTPTGWTQQQVYPARQQQQWLWILMIVLLLLVLVGSFANLRKTGALKTTLLPLHTFQVTARPQLVIQDFAGTLTLQAGNNPLVSVSATEYTSSLGQPDDVQYTATQQGNIIEVKSNKPDASLAADENVDMDITLPALSNIQATLAAGSITLLGISGVIAIQAITGSISFNNGTIAAYSSFQSEAGSIAFNGSLAPAGNYVFTTHTGSIDIALPASSTFMLDASTNTGTIRNEFSSNQVGSNPTNQLQVHTDAGSINIHQV